MNIVAITIGSYPYGEATTNRNISLLKGLVELNHDVELLVLSPTNKKCAGERIKKGVIDGIKYEYTSYTINWPKSTLKKMMIVTTSVVNALNKLKKSHSNKKIDSLLIFTTKPYLMHPFIIFAKRKNIKIYHQQNEHPELIYMESKQYIENIKLNYYLRLINKFNGLFVISNYLMEYFSKYTDLSKICIINMTVDINRFNIKYKSPYDFKYITYCGTMHGNKDGLKDLINAYVLISNEINHKLLLIGDIQDSRTSSIVNLVKNNNLENKIIFPGSISSNDMPMYLQNSEIHVLSRPDNLQAKGGFPTKLGEYLMTGKPVIVTSVGEIPRFLEDKISAFLVDPNNIKMFANKIKYVVNNYQFALNVAETGKKIAINNFNYFYESRKLSNFLLNQSQNNAKI